MPELNEENIIKRIPPHDDEAEESVLGSMLVNQEVVAEASQFITGDDFYNRYNVFIHYDRGFWDVKPDEHDYIEQQILRVLVARYNQSRHPVYDKMLKDGN